MGFHLSSLYSVFCTRLRQWAKPKDEEDVRGYAVTHNRCGMVESSLGLAEPLTEVVYGVKGLLALGWRGWGRSQLLGI